MRRQIEVVNVVVSLDFDVEFDLIHLHRELDTVESDYSPEDVHWLKTRFEPNNTYVAFYQSGKAMIAGSDSVSEAEVISERVTEAVQEITDSEDTPDRRIQNVVAKYSVGYRIPLEKLAVWLGLENVEYEPEQFPALIYMDDSQALLVFSSGEVVCTGATNKEKATEAIRNFVDDELDRFMESLPT